MYLVPREVTTRFEFLPGYGFRELAIVLAGLGAAGLLFTALSAVGAPLPLRLMPSALLAAGGAVAAQGGPFSPVQIALRWRAWATGQRRWVYRFGHEPQAPVAGMAAAPAAGPTGLMAALVSALGFARPARAGTAKPDPKRAAVQEWYPVRDVTDVLLRRDGWIVAALRIEPINWGLKSAAEQGRLIQGLSEAVNTVTDPQLRLQFFSLPRPVDTSAYLSGLAELVRELDPARQALLRQYIAYVQRLAASGEATTREHYILLSRPGGTAAADDLRRAVRDLHEALGRANITAEALDAPGLLRLLSAWAYPAQAAYEPRPEAVMFSPFVMGGAPRDAAADSSAG